MNDLHKIQDQLVLTEDNRLLLGKVSMILMPAWFFSGIIKRIIGEIGYEVAAKIYYEAGFEGAYKWGKVQIEAGLSGREVMDQYLDSMTHRGWGRFEIVRFDDNSGEGLFRLFNSAVASESGLTDQPACLWVPGAMAGAMQIILDHADRPVKVNARELRCLSQESDYCEFSVEPVQK